MISINSYILNFYNLYNFKGHTTNPHPPPSTLPSVPSPAPWPPAFRASHATPWPPAAPGPSPHPWRWGRAPLPARKVPGGLGTVRTMGEGTDMNDKDSKSVL